MPYPELEKLDPTDRHVTVMDVAGLAGVSHTTVSLSLRDDPRVKPATRQRVKAVADSLGYRPHAGARALASKVVPYVGLLYGCSPAPLATPAAQLMRAKLPVVVALIGLLESRGLHLVLDCEEPFLDSDKGLAMREAPAILRQRHVSGVLVLNSVWPELYRAITRWNVPCVGVLTQQMPDIPLVSVDHTCGAVLAVRHLIELGHRRIALLPGSKGSPAVTSKTEHKALGYVSAMNQAGLGVMPGWDARVEGPHTEAVERLLPRILAADPAPTAILAYDDTVAVRVIEHLHQSGLRVTQDISVVSLEDNFISDA